MKLLVDLEHYVRMYNEICLLTLVTSVEINNLLQMCGEQ